jgi:probable blue pigment (indigoidine) exporter
LPPDRPLLATTVRVLPAGLILLPFARALPAGIWLWRTLALGTLNIGAFNFLLFVAAYRLPGGVAAMIMAVQPMVVLILAALLIGTAFGPRTLWPACSAGPVSCCSCSGGRRRWISSGWRRR